MILNEIYIKNKIVIIFVGAICGVMLDIQEEMLYINRMQRGDAAAFEYFFKKYMKMLYLTIYLSVRLPITMVFQDRRFTILLRE